MSGLLKEASQSSRLHGSLIELEENGTVCSWMKIGNVRQRATLAKIFETLPDEKLSDITFLIAIGIVGIHEVIEIRDRYEDRRYRCVQYAFGTVKGEPWAIQPIYPEKSQEWKRSLFSQTCDFLASKGYAIVDLPQPGDVVGYACISDLPDKGRQVEFKHFGIYNSSDVVSKIGDGNIFCHDLKAILYRDNAVDTVVFFRKTFRNELEVELLV
ncbi:MAG: hypothetical protein A2W22_00455 [Candidatus Levybacteria bacterium RBG_16_35_11]|nr:MAG: hypothetical protein A2W22_00455 [Candidatus Levybacteria bacterium RBG_16_35_11]